MLNAFALLEEQFGFKVTYLPVSSEGTVNVKQVEEALQDDTFLVSIMSVNNEIGSINDVEAIAKMLKKYPKILFHVDATQLIGKSYFNFENVDLVSFSAHKFFGIKGIGCLVKNKNLIIEPLIHGGKSTTNYRNNTPKKI